MIYFWWILQGYLLEPAICWIIALAMAIGDLKQYLFAATAFLPLILCHCLGLPLKVSAITMLPLLLYMGGFLLAPEWKWGSAPPDLHLH